MITKGTKVATVFCLSKRENPFNGLRLENVSLHLRVKGITRRCQRCGESKIPYSDNLSRMWNSFCS